MVDVYARADLSAGWSMAVALGVSVALLAMAALAFVRSFRRSQLATREAASAGEARPLAEGETVLTGIVELAEEQDIAVRVDVWQDGTEHEGSGGWSHRWEEIDREILVRPFYLRLASGERVRVEPPKNVEVADALDKKVWINRTRRVLSAELVPGERIHARGTLERSSEARPGPAYRDVAWGWALRASSGDKMLLSSEPLGDGLRRRARVHRFYGLVALLALVVVTATLAGFYQRAAAGATLVPLRDKLSYLVQEDDSDPRYEYVLVHAAGRSKVTEATYNRVSTGADIPIRRASDDNWNLGASPKIGKNHGSFLVVFLVGVLCAYAIRHRMTRPWFKRKLEETGTGQLPEPPSA